jgi:cellulose synthase/poly-beta-1,6-N-acetylglucosamine synthase-like glycosyltransferase/exo-beta-1,3-glucanase (GH17 family)
MFRLGLVLLVSAVATVGGWRLLDSHVQAANVEGPLHGVTYAPWAKDQDPLSAKSSGIFSFLRTAFTEEPPPAVKPRKEQIEHDFAMMSGHVDYVRTYRTSDGGEDMPEIAARYGLKLVPGAWIYSAVEAKQQFGRDAADVNAEETRALIRMANQNPNVIDRVMVGNENILRWDAQTEDRDHTAVSPAQLIREIRNVKRNVKVPVSTAEPWHVWLRYPELAREVDFLAVHILPYWDEQSSETPLEYLKNKIKLLRQAYPNKNIIVTEVGWPSNGAARRSPGTGLVKRATPAEQAKNVRDMVAWLKSQNIDYFVVEAIDQPWKSYDLEGKAGGYWGMWNADRQPKFAWMGPIETFPQWWVYAAWSLAAALPLMALFLWKWRNVGMTGQLAFCGLVALSTSAVAYGASVAAGTYMVTGEVIGWAMLAFFLVLSLAMALVQALEMVETIWRRHWRREALPAAKMIARQPTDRVWPKVSLHLAICNEPPAMVMQTLDSLAALDYPDFEVIVIDNNTKDPAVWRPVQDYCAQLGERFRFFNFDVIKGFKAGALNYVLSQTSPDAKVIGVIDSDYMVRPDWLKAVVPYFDDPKVSYVQAPQDHRDWRDDRFKEMLNWEYAGFFDIGMCLRNEYDAIIQHGTMTLVRKDRMEEMGGWATWCITEDTELGLRLMEKGYGAMYSRERFGHGLTPDHFAGYKKQRFRWAYGAMQIMKAHARKMMGKGTQLTFWQKYHFVTGWLPWFADALNLIFTWAGLVWALAVLVPPVFGLKPVGLPPAEFIVPTIGIFVFKLIYSFGLYADRVNCTFRQSLGAALAGLALTYTVGRAVIYGLMTSRLPFMRTPKMDERATLGMALGMARGEAVLMILLWIAALVLWNTSGVIDPEARLWAGFMIVQSLPFTAAVVVSLVNALEQMRHAQAVFVPAVAAAPAGEAPAMQPAQ